MILLRAPGLFCKLIPPCTGLQRAICLLFRLLTRMFLPQGWAMRPERLPASLSWNPWVLTSSSSWPRARLSLRPERSCCCA